MNYWPSLVPSLHSQLFFACCKKKRATCEKKLGVETGNEAITGPLFNSNFNAETPISCMHSGEQSGKT